MGEDLQVGGVEDSPKRVTIEIRKVSNGYIVGSGFRVNEKVAETLEEALAIVKEEFEG